MLGGTNSFGGHTSVSAGTLTLSSALALQNSTLDTSGSGIVSFGALSSATLGGLTGVGKLSLSNTAAAGVIVSVGNNNSSMTYSGTLSGAGSLIKLGSGTLTLASSNTFAGPVAINQGELLINGSLASPVTVNSGGVLAGTGSLSNVTVNAGGHLAPGNAPGLLNVSGSLTLMSSAVMDYELDTPLDSDEVLMMPTGLLTLSGQQFSDFNFTPLARFGPGGYTLIDAGSISGTLGTNTSGTIDGLPVTLAVQGNELVLNVVPEPSTLALMVMAAIGRTVVVARKSKHARWRAFPS